MLKQRVAGPVLFAMIVIAACGGSAHHVAALSLTEYVEKINGITLEFEDTGSRAAELDLPVDGDLGNAAAVFVAYDNVLEGLRVIPPPPEVAAQHDTLVIALAELQNTVLAYLQKASLEGGFEFPDITADPGISIKLSAFDEACIDLGDTLRGLGAEGVPTVCSEGG